MKIGIVLACLVAMLAGCFDTPASRLLIDSVDEERAWVSFGDPRIATVFSMPISYNPAPLQIGDEPDVVVHLRYGSTQPVTDFLQLRIEGGIQLIGKEGIDFFQYTEADEELVFGSLGSPQWCGGPDYYFPIPPSKIVSVQFRVVKHGDGGGKGICGVSEGNYAFHFAVTRTGSEGELASHKHRNPDVKSVRVTSGTTLWLPVMNEDMFYADIAEHRHPSQWGILTPELIATLDYKPTDATIPTKTRLYNMRWNAELALAREDYILFPSLIESYRELLNVGEDKWGRYLGYFARQAFPNDYPPAHIIAKYPMVDIEGGWPE